MQQRCDNPNGHEFHNYGGRGIRVCDRWRDFSMFLADMGERPDGMTLDRVDNNADYEPGNCRWATSKRQGRNKRCVRFVVFKGRRMAIIDLAEELGICVVTLKGRIDRGWPEEEWDSPARVTAAHVSRRFPGAMPLSSSKAA